MRKERITDRQKKIMEHLNNNFYPGSIETKMISSGVVKVTDITGEIQYFSIDENDIISCSEHLDMETLNNDMSEYVFEHIDTVQQPQALNDRQTLVVSAFGGPGSGKTVACMDICQQLKKRGYNAEYVSEVAKDYVYDENYEMLDGTPEHQYDMLQEQVKRVDRYMGKVDFVITDSPILLNGIYNKQLTPEYERQLLLLHSQYNNFVFFVNRDERHYQQEGRLQDLQASMEKDAEIREMLDENKIYYGTYEHRTVDKIVDNSIHTLNRIRSEHEGALIRRFVAGNYYEDSIEVASVGDRKYQLTDRTGDSITVTIQADKVTLPEGFRPNSEINNLYKSHFIHPDVKKVTQLLGEYETACQVPQHLRLTQSASGGDYEAIEGVKEYEILNRYRETDDLAKHDLWRMQYWSRKDVPAENPDLQRYTWNHYAKGYGFLQNPNKETVASYSEVLKVDDGDMEGWNDGVQKFIQETEANEAEFLKGPELLEGMSREEPKGREGMNKIYQSELDRANELVEAYRQDADNYYKVVYSSNPNYPFNVQVITNGYYSGNGKFCKDLDAVKDFVEKWEAERMQQYSGDEESIVENKTKDPELPEGINMSEEEQERLVEEMMLEAQVTQGMDLVR